MHAINSFGGKSMFFTDSVKVVKGVSGNAVYLETGMGSAEVEHPDVSELSISVWRKSDGMPKTDDSPFLKLHNLYIYFTSINFLAVKLGDNAPIITQVRDGTDFFHWFFTYKQGGVFCAYRNALKVLELPAPDVPIKFDQPFILGGGSPHATFDEITFYDSILDQIYINGLYQFISRDANISSVESIIAESIPQHTPRYLGTIKTAPDKQQVNIFMGQTPGITYANVSDWVLVVEPIDGFRRGYCYRYNGLTWDLLNPPERYVAEYTACLKDQLELTDLFDGTDNQFFGTVLCQYLGFNEAVGRSLTANQVFVDNLVAKKVLVDSDVNDPTDFELTINRDVGILAKNNGKKVFEVSPVGGVNAGAVQLLENGIGIKDGELFVENNGWRGTLRACEDGVEFAIMGGDGGAMTKKQMQTTIRNGVLSLFVLGNITACGNIYHGNTGAVVNGWTPKISGTTQGLAGVAWNGNTWVVVGYNDVILASTDNGNTWTHKTSGITGVGFRRVAYNSSTWVAAGSYGIVSISTDNGNTWTRKTIGTTHNLHDVAYNNNTWVAVGWCGLVFVSTDNGNTWVPKTSGTTLHLNGIACNGNTWVAVGSGGLIFVSTDNGNTWTQKASGTTRVLEGIACNGTTWVAVGAAGTILVSTDTSLW